MAETLRVSHCGLLTAQEAHARGEWEGHADHMRRACQLTPDDGRPA